MLTHKIINSCQISGSKNLYKIVNLGFLPPVNQLYKINSNINSQNFFHTELLYCPESKLVQLNVIVDKKQFFPNHIHIQVAQLKYYVKILITYIKRLKKIYLKKIILL